MSNIEVGLRAIISVVVRAEIREALSASAQPDEFLSTAHAAKVADVAPGTIRRWVKTGELTKYSAGRVLRVSRRELERLLRAGARNDESPEAEAARRFGG